MNQKDIILLIPYYNDPPGLYYALESIYYPHGKYEVLIIDDGSTEPVSSKWINAILPQTKVTVVRMNKNQGIVNALNRGLDELRNRKDFKYIARLDCGDRCHPDRLVKQVEILDQDSSIGLVGTWCVFKDRSGGRKYHYRTQAEHVHIVRQMHLKCVFIHPTVMYRREVLETCGSYPTAFPHAEDYAFFWKILKVYKGCVLPFYYAEIGMHTGSVSVKYFRLQLRSRINVIRTFGTIKSLKFVGIILHIGRILLPYRTIREIKFRYLGKP